MDATKLVAMVLYVECPRCGAHCEGFVSDPRGNEEEIECEDCGQKFDIQHDIEIILN